jgi:uncharacterized protein (DUF305 family)
MIHPATQRRRRQRLAALAPVLLLLALATGCGEDTSNDPVSATGHNDADVAFATDMIQHHAQALAMVNLTVERPMDPEFQALSEGIRDAQGPEIETMSDWLEEWGEEVPQTVNDHMNHDMGTMPEGTSDMPGMMSAEEMDELENADDDDFQKLWLEMMIRHHRGAIDMAEAEVDDGRYEPAVVMAKSIISSQEEEIEQMEGLLTIL